MPTATISPTSRDLQVLFLIYTYNTCSIAHIAMRLFNGSLTSCYRRISQLRQAGLISFQRLGSSSGIGSGKALLSLPAKGREVLASEYLHVPSAAVKPLKSVSTTYGRDHHLALCDFWLALELAIEAATSFNTSLSLDWLSEKALRTNPIRVTNSRRSTAKIRLFYPDGEFTIRLTSSSKQTFKLEMEMDPLRRPQIIKDKLAGYFDYLSSLSKDCATSSEAPLAELPFILWVVPDSKSEAVLTAWILELAKSYGDDPSVFWITTRDQIDARSILRPVWKVAGVEPLQSLIPASAALMDPAAAKPALRFQSSPLFFDGVSESTVF
jgi:hypothetical protein